MPGVLIRREKGHGDTNTHKLIDAHRTQTERMPCDDWGRNCSDPDARQRTLRIAHLHQKLEEAKNHSTLEPSERAWPSWHLDWGVLHPGLWHYILLFQATQFVVLCYGSHNKLIQCLSGWFDTNLSEHRERDLNLRMKRIHQCKDSKGKCSRQSKEHSCL